MNTWNLWDYVVAGNYPMVDSLGGSGVASIDLPDADGGAGNDQGGLTTNYLRWGYVNYWHQPDVPFVIHLGAAAAGKTVKLAWYIAGAAQPFTSAITVTGATPATVQMNWGADNLVFQTVVADGSGDVSGVFQSSAGTNTNDDCPVAGLQIYQAP